MNGDGGDNNMVEMNEDLLIEILILLPPHAVFRFMSVSKRWKNIINTPLFLDCYSRRQRRRHCSPRAMLALFPKAFHCGGTPKNLLPILNNYYYITYPRSDLDNNITYYVPEKFGHMINSSNGLIICCAQPYKCYPTYTVYNPVTERFVTLPPLLGRVGCKSIRIGFMCEENTSELKANYIVVRVSGCIGKWPSDRNRWIDTYSSKTGQWVLSKAVTTGEIVQYLDDPTVVANRVFHWFAEWPPMLVVYDPYDGLNHLQLIVLPMDIHNSRCGVITRSPDEDILWWGKTDHGEYKMTFWALPKGVNGGYKRTTTIPSDEWVVKYKIYVDCFCLITERDCFVTGWWRVSNPTVDLDAFVSWDPLVVLVRNYETWFLYNLDTDTWELVGCYGRLIHISPSSYYQPSLLPFVETSFLSSYARL
ncbi:hypothetical protein ACP275_06G193600 [Erythranthe tilingii]